MTTVTPITADEIRRLLKDALKQFGEYQFSDKGAHEVMDVDAITNRLDEMPPADVIAVLEDVYHTKTKARFHVQLVSELLWNMQGTEGVDAADARWEALMQSDILQECYDG